MECSWIWSWILGIECWLGFAARDDLDPNGVESGACIMYDLEVHGIRSIAIRASGLVQ